MSDPAPVARTTEPRVVSPPMKDMEHVHALDDPTSENPDKIQPNTRERIEAVAEDVADGENRREVSSPRPLRHKCTGKRHVVNAEEFRVWFHR